ncbi:MAG: hypothetical protein FRX48_05118 [Lasallia pustulata]|uniref:Uncharacterized protein n=1 Tax=Lasallia pustulata TaxID=136370 RepID=A0A1W5DCR5_9LECA|nr:MAG: hypothetical protein FRX48_05118 [Lasallia pustulata]SLM40983.1 hypothetical protein LPUS_11856 [Lasallia pustulata]
MGNLCGKQSPDSDPFSHPGRTVGSAPPPSSAPRASVPSKISSPGRPLGGTGPARSDTGDARQAAARAAEERAARAKQHKGKLGRDLARERQQTRTGTLEGISREERRKRDADEVVEARNWN